jgi:DNA-binding NtrC family response regulator
MNEKCTINTAISSAEVIRQLRKGVKNFSYDLVITHYGNDGMDALNILKEVKDIQSSVLSKALSHSSDYVPQCPVVLVHEDGCIDSVIRKGQLIRLGAVDFTTDCESLIMAILRAFSVAEKGRDRNNFIPVPGTASSSKIRNDLDSTSTKRSYEESAASPDNALYHLSGAETPVRSEDSQQIKRKKL